MSATQGVSAGGFPPGRFGRSSPPRGFGRAHLPESRARQQDASGPLTIAMSLLQCATLLGHGALKTVRRFLTGTTDAVAESKTRSVIFHASPAGRSHSRTHPQHGRLKRLLRKWPPGQTFEKVPEDFSRSPAKGVLTVLSEPQAIAESQSIGDYNHEPMSPHQHPSERLRERKIGLCFLSC